MLRAIPKFVVALSHVGVHGESSDPFGPPLPFLCVADILVRRAVDQVFAVALVGSQLGITLIRHVKHVGVVGTQAPVQPAHDPLGVSGAGIVALCLPAVGVVNQFSIKVAGVGDPCQHQLFAVVHTGDAGCLALGLGQGGQEQACQDGDDRDDDQQLDEGECLRFFHTSQSAFAYRAVYLCSITLRRLTGR